MNIEPSQIIALLTIAMATALATRRLALPYTVGLVVVGAALALLHVDIKIGLTREIIFDVILPPLLFEAALNLRWADLRKDLGPIFTLAIVGTLIAAAFIAFAMVQLLHWPLVAALAFGALIAATDPVSVIALFKDLGVHGRLRTLVESESLFNDVVAAVLFSLVLAFAAPEGAPPALDMGAQLASIVLGGAAIGAAVGAAGLLLIGRTSDHLVEAGLTTIAAFAAFFGAEHFHFSGILATVVAGLLMGNIGLLRDEQSTVSERGREFVLSFWEYAAFLSNSAIFLLIGLSVGRMSLDLKDALALAGIIAIVLASRALAVYPLSAVFMRTSNRISWGQQHVLWWGGLRGALGLALALSLPATLPFRNEIVIATFGVAAFSIVVQGLTMALVLRRLDSDARS